SILGRVILDARGAFLHSLPTYLMKLEPNNLRKKYANAIDRRITTTTPTLTIHMRLRDVVQLLHDGLIPKLITHPKHPLHLLNIADGPTADSLNTLIVLQKEQPKLLAGRSISIHVLDLH